MYMYVSDYSTGITTAGTAYSIHVHVHNKEIHHAVSLCV